MLSVVIPVYGCEQCLWALQERLEATLTPLVSDYEIIYVEDASPDQSWQVLQVLTQKHPRARAVQLSRNFGQQAAISAGLTEARGAWAVVLDCDLQDPPELIAQLYEKAQQGFDVVLARRQRKQYAWHRRLAAQCYARVLGCFVPYPVDAGYGSFSLLARPVIDAYLRVRTQDQHYLFMLHWLGFRRASVDYVQADRHDRGNSAYTFASLLQCALEGLLLQTTRLLRWMIALGFFFGLTGVFLSCIFIYQYFTLSVLPGWTSLSVLILFGSGGIIMSLAVVGLYVGKIFEQVQGRPQYVIARRLGD